MTEERSRIVKVYATCEYEIFNSESVQDAERRASEDAEEELGSIIGSGWNIELVEFDRERVY